MAKLKPLGEFNGHKGWIFYCPGCKEYHGFNSAWTFDGDLEAPTVSPSLLTTMPGANEYRCHAFIKNGKIEYLPDCSHDLKGQTVDMIDIPDEEL